MRMPNSFRTRSYIVDCKCKMEYFALAALSLLLAAQAIVINVQSISVWINIK